MDVKPDSCFEGRTSMTRVWKQSGQNIWTYERWSKWTV